MIDHTRAFRLGKSLLQPNALTTCDSALLESLRGYHASGACGVDREEPDRGWRSTRSLSRRDLIVKLFDQRVTTLGQAAVLFALN